MTQRSRRPSGSWLSVSGGGSGGSLGAPSAPLETLERDEIRRTRWFCYVSFTISVVAGASLWWLDGDPLATALLIGALAASVLATVFMLYRTRGPVQFRRLTTGLRSLATSRSPPVTSPRRCTASSTRCRATRATS